MDTEEITLENASVVYGYGKNMYAIKIYGVRIGYIFPTSKGAWYYVMDGVNDFSKYSSNLYPNKEEAAIELYLRYRTLTG